MYVDGFVLPVPKKHLKTYRRMAKLGAKVWKDHGALEYRETIGDDLNTKRNLPFPKTVNAKADETVVFSWIVYKSRAHRDKVVAEVMKDKRMTSFDPKSMPFDEKRMAYGGFKLLVSA